MALHADVLLPDVVYALETADLDAPPVFSRLIRLAKGLAAVDILVDLLPGMPIFALNELAELGPAAVSAVAQVRAALISSEDDGDRFAAAHAWWRITTDPQYLLTPLMATLHPNKIRPRHAEILGKIGQPAEASLPFLREVRDRLRRYRIGGFNTSVRQDEELRAAATHAITRITHETT
jgi:hypothetical protein